MNGFERNRDELKDIIKACNLLVKRHRRLEAVHMADRFSRLANKATRLHDRRDLLLPAYVREVLDLLMQYRRLCEEAEHYRPGITRRRLLPPAPALSIPGASVSRLVHITLPADQWQLIDYRITVGLANSQADYFRKAHFAKGGDSS